MKWEIGALKMLAKNPTVPGIALLDVIGELEKQQKKNAGLTKQLKTATAALSAALHPTTPSDTMLAEAVLNKLREDYPL